LITRTRICLKQLDENAVHVIKHHDRTHHETSTI
jgi:hypothetical protein